MKGRMSKALAGILVMVGLLGIGCAISTTPCIAPPPCRDQIVPFRMLKPGDKVTIALRGIRQPRDIEAVVDKHGDVQLPLVGKIRVKNLTTFDAERVIEKAYDNGGYFKKISVILVAPPGVIQSRQPIL